MAAILKFERVEIGQLLESPGIPDTFMKVPEKEVGIRCNCGHTYNALNINPKGVFYVHFCLTIEVVVYPGAYGFERINEAMKEQY